MNKKTLFAAIALVLVASLCAVYFPNFATAATTTGTCGTNLTWTFESDTGTLTISGTGAMTNYSISSSYSYAPWRELDIKNLVIESGVTSIGSYAFYSGINSYDGDYTFTSVTLPNKLASIGEYAFHKCTQLTEISLPNTLATLGGNAFENCTALKSITLPDRITAINSSTFRNCTSLASIAFPKRLTSIGSYAFQNCDSLSAVTIPDTVTSIGQEAFSDCDGLTQIHLPTALQTIESKTFYSCNALSDVQMPSALTTIGEHAFFDCSTLETISFPETLTTISTAAFENCTNLTALTFPASLTSIAAYAFSECINVLEITFCGEAPNISYNAFRNVYADVYYPASATTWTADVMKDYGGQLYYSPYMDPNSLIPTLQLGTPSLSFEGAIHYNAYFTVENGEGFPLDKMGMIIFDSKLTDGTIEDAIEVIPGVTYNADANVYMAQTNGIPAKNLGDAVYFKLYAQLADGSYVYSNVAGYNAVVYAKTILKSETASAEMKELVREMLNYGAAAQKFFDYKTDSLMNATIA